MITKKKIVTIHYKTLMTLLTQKYLNKKENSQILGVDVSAAFQKNLNDFCVRGGRTNS